MSGLVGVQNGCIVTRGHVATIRLRSAGGARQTAGVVLGAGTVQRKFRLLVERPHV